MKCAIYGAGSLGTVLGAYLTEGGIDVDLVNRNRAHVAALREHGAVITGVVCGEGRRVGVPTPINERIVEIIHAEQSGTLAPKPENIERFHDLI